MSNIPEEIRPMIEALNRSFDHAKVVRGIFREALKKYRDIESGDFHISEKMEARRILFTHLVFMKDFADSFPDSIGINSVNGLYETLCDNYGLREIGNQVENMFIEIRGDS